jgi:hypothetical protein
MDLMLGLYCTFEPKGCHIVSLSLRGRKVGGLVLGPNVTSEFICIRLVGLMLG